jgi:hypothetical protein
MSRIVIGSPNLTQPLLLHPGLRPAMLEQHRQSYKGEESKATYPSQIVTENLGQDIYLGTIDKASATDDRCPPIISI